jgi:hypothetical protein
VAGVALGLTKSPAKDLEEGSYDSYLALAGSCASLNRNPVLLPGLVLPQLPATSPNWPLNA